MPDSSFLKRISIVLVDTLQPGNIGSAARAMSNMGLSRLKLVNPRGIFSSECLKMAGSAVDLVSRAEIFSTLGEAVAGENIVIGTTSSRERLQKQRVWPPREMARLVREYAATLQVALVFGSEKRGLSDQNLAYCQYLVTVPADPAYPVLNLAQAVMVLTYEIFNSAESDLNPHLEVASQEAREQMFEHLQRMLLRIGFLSDSNPDHIMNAIRRFLGRADLTPRDLQILRGIYSQMEWFAEEGHALPPEKVRKP